MNVERLDNTLTMDVTFAQFVRALRNANVRVSPAETLDAYSVLNRVGINDRNFLKDALALTLAKTISEKLTFDDTFERFFGQLGFQDPPKQSMLQSFETSLDGNAALKLVSPSLAEDIEDLLNGNSDRLATKLQRAAAEAGIEDIGSLREKRSFELRIATAMGLPKLDTYLKEDPDARSVPMLSFIRQYLYRQVKDFVDRQYGIHVDPTAKRAILESALKSHLNRMPPEYYSEVRKVVERLARQFIKAHKRRAKKAQRGLLEYKKTIRQNMAYDGNVYELRWRRIRKEPATVFVICDVSNSVSSIARFLLLFLYELVDILPQVRAFAFSSQLGEVTSVFRNKASDSAIEEVLFDWGKGNTDYGRAFFDFRQLCAGDLNKRSTVIVLGDGRTNFYEPGTSDLALVAKRVKQLYWLNPEVRSQWTEGDSEMRRYAPHCREVFLCNQLIHIERFADRLLSSVH